MQALEQLTENPADAGEQMQVDQEAEVRPLRKAKPGKGTGGSKLMEVQRRLEEKALPKLELGREQMEVFTWNALTK